MKAINIVLIVGALVIGFVVGYFVGNAITGNEEQYLYTLNADSGSFVGETLTLEGPTDITYFSNRPRRDVGELSVSEFLGQWDTPGGFKEDPPNVALALLSKDDTRTVILELVNPVFVEGTLSFDTIVLSGQLPASFDAATLFVDSTVNPQITD